MNITEKQLAKKIIQSIVDELNALENLGMLEWKVEDGEKQFQYRSWAKSTMKHIVEASGTAERYKGFFDGSAKPNPGAMQIGGLIKDNKGKVVYNFSSSRGEGTNNRAEYMALIELLTVAIEKGIKIFDIAGDSLLVVNQVNGEWKANDMIEYRNQVRTLLENFGDWSLTHVPRALNAEADKLTR